MLQGGHECRLLSRQGRPVPARKPGVQPHLQKRIKPGVPLAFLLPCTLQTLNMYRRHLKFSARANRTSPAPRAPRRRPGSEHSSRSHRSRNPGDMSSGHSMRRSRMLSNTPCSRKQSRSRDSRANHEDLHCTAELPVDQKSSCSCRHSFVVQALLNQGPVYAAGLMQHAKIEWRPDSRSPSGTPHLGGVGAEGRPQ